MWSKAPVKVASLDPGAFSLLLRGRRQLLEAELIVVTAVIVLSAAGEAGGATSQRSDPCQLKGATRTAVKMARVLTATG